jgi:DNA-binding HxlR family transcriptional regulator
LRFATHPPIVGVVPVRTYDQNCSIARTLQVVGERWTLLVLREVFTGQRRFEEIQRNLGVATNILADRLETLVDAGILERRALADRSDRSEYRLTEKGLDLWPVIVSLLQYGDRYYAPAGPPVILRHRDCGGEIDSHRICSACGQRLSARDSMASAGAPAPASAPR